MARSTVEAGSSGSGKATANRRRLHVSGLNPAQCSIDDLKSRFTSFGLSVVDVHNWPPAKNAVGDDTNWCFVSVQGDDGSVSKAMNLLNGTMWKGSKLRIGNAKERRWRTDASNGDIELFKSGSEASKKGKRRTTGRGAQGVESAEIGTPVTPEQVDGSSPWGWRKTTAGHLVRPLHMRPSHPLERPTPVLQDGERLKRRKRKVDVDDAKPVTRARRITIDPQRYGAVHLSGLVLDDQSSKPSFTAQEWRCVESEDGKNVLWSLFDGEGGLIKEELFEIARANADTKAAELDIEDMSSASSAVSEDEDAMPDDVDAAIDLAGDMSASEEEEEAGKGNGESSTHMLQTQNETFYSTVDYSHFDPDEDDAFSDGYQEVRGDEKPIDSIDWAGEKEGHMALLKRMFGANQSDVSLEAQVQPSLSVVESDSESSMETEEEDDQSMTPAVKGSEIAPGIARRAALLNNVSGSGNVIQGQFTPVARFDPGNVEDAGSDDADDKELETSEEQQAQPRISKMPSAEEPRPADKVEMTKLTDMFRPKELKGGFSLMADLELDLDDELNFEPDIDVDDEGRADADFDTSLHAQRHTVDVDDRRTHHARSQSAKRLNIFPRFDSHGRIEKNGNDSFASILREIDEAGKRQHDENTYEGKKAAALSRFFVCDDEQTLAQKWQERKATLTQEYKRRHREALKKKKRKFVGSRTAATGVRRLA